MSRLAILLALSGTPALATGLEIDVAGEANGTIVIDLFEDVAPQHVAQITALAEEGAYDGVAFHRVIEGFMAQTGDVQYGVEGADAALAGTGGSDRPFTRGVVGMARSADPDSANSQFFIMFADAPHLDGQYTVVGEVTEGLEVLDAIKRGAGANGGVEGEPDRMVDVRVAE